MREVYLVQPPSTLQQIPLSGHRPSVTSRRPVLRCRAADDLSKPDAAQAAADATKGALLARLARAKQYKEAAQSGDRAPELPPPPSVPQPGSSAPSSSRSTTDVAQLRIASVAAASVAAPSSSQQAPLAPGPSVPSPLAEQLDPAVAALIAKAQAPLPQPPLDAYSAYLASASTEQQRRAEEEAAAAAAAAERLELWQRASYNPGTTDLLNASPRRQGAGSADQAADFLVNVLNKQVTDLGGEGDLDGSSGSSRMEEYTLRQLERMKQRGAEIITVDPTYRPGDAADTSPASSASTAEALTASTSETSTDGVAAAAAAGKPAQARYQPKVSTWGMFPRPNDISKAYGGGRTIKPGEPLEAPEAKAARERSFAEAMASYKRSIGTDIEPEDEASATALYDAGMALFERGALLPALAEFEAACELAPLRTRIGGLSGLQRAIVLDSLGRSAEAEVLYKKLRGHSLPQVSKKAKQMLFGFQAAVFLKTDKSKVDAGWETYNKYFRQVADRNKVYVATEEEKRQDAEMTKMASGIATTVILAPVALFAVLALAQAQR